MTDVEQEPRAARGFGWPLWLTLALLWYATMPWRPLLDPDEGRYAEIPREMISSGDWITPHLDGLKYFEKPPLQYWATATAYTLFGLSEWTARLWTVGLGFLCLPAIWSWTRRCYGRPAADAALVALAASPYFELLAHLNLLDPGFTFWLLAAILTFGLAQCAPAGGVSERRWMFAAWASAALAVLSKGIVVGVLAAGSLLVYSLLERDVRPWRRLHLWPGVAVFLLITAPWFALVSWRNPSFAGFFFVHEHFTRFLTTVHQRSEPWWYFGALLLIGALPWLGVLAPASAGAWRETASHNSFKPLKFLLVFCGVTVIFFSLSESKLAPYILPMMPALAILVGVQAASRPRFVPFTAQFTLWLLPVLIIGFCIYATRRFGGLPPASIVWLACGGAAAAVGWLLARRARTSRRAAVWVTVAAAALAWQCLLGAFALLPARSSYQLVAAVKPYIHPDTQLFTIGQYRETLSPYLARTMTLVHFEGELAFGLTQDPGGELSTEAFLARWNSARDAVVFISPSVLDEWRHQGLQGRVIGADRDTVVLSRS